MRSKKSLLVEQATLNWDTTGLIAGVDEAGRGPLAGPVVAAAVILDDLQPIKGLNDSKKLSAKRREQLFDEIKARALCFAIAEATVQEIDELNILQNSFQKHLATYRAAPQEAAKLIDAGDAPVAAGDPIELAAYTVCANVILNLDEIIMRD